MGCQYQDAEFLAANGEAVSALQWSSIIFHQDGHQSVNVLSLVVNWGSGGNGMELFGVGG